jgi:hypothetical protein
MTRTGRTAVGLPFPTEAPDQTKIQVFSHVSTPTKHYRIPCPPCGRHWCFRFGLPFFTKGLIWAGAGCRVPLPSTTAW